MLGIDIVSIDRIKRIVDRSGVDFLHRFLNADEIKQCVFESGAFNIQRIAGFYAAKEALSKALGCGIGKNLAFSDIQIYKSKSGQPKVKLKKCVKKKFSVKKIHLSISHERHSYLQSVRFSSKCLNAPKDSSDKSQKGLESGYAIACVMLKYR